MARSARAMSAGPERSAASWTPTWTGQHALADAESPLPAPLRSPTSASAPLRSKKASHLAILRMLRKLRSPSNSDGEDGDDDQDAANNASNDLDLDFGCSGLTSFIDLDESSSSGYGVVEELHISLPYLPAGQTCVELPSRSASIADSMVSSILSINLSSSECTTLSTPTSCSQSASASARSSFSTSPTSPISTSNLTGKNCFNAHGSPRTSTSRNVSVPPHNHPTAILEVAEEQEESEEQAILRRQHEEQAAIDALEAYFAFRRASDTPASAPTRRLNEMEAGQRTFSTKLRNATAAVTHDRRTSSPSLLPYTLRYSETYVNEPLPTLSMSNHNDTSLTSSIADPSHSTLPTRSKQLGLQPASLISPTSAPVAGGREAVIFPRPPLRTRRSEASLTDARSMNSGSVRKRPSLAPGMTTGAGRPRGPTFSNSRSSIAFMIHEDEEHFSGLPSIPPTPTTAGTVNTSFNRTTPTSSNFLNLDPSPESPNFKMGEVLPSPPRSSSLAAAADWPDPQNDRCQPFAKKDDMTTPSPTKVSFEPGEMYHYVLDQYRFPERGMHSTPAVSRSASTLSLSNSTDADAAMTVANTVPKVHSPLGSATAFRRGSLVYSPPLTFRGRAGSVAAASNGGDTNRNAIYEYI